MHQFSNNLHHGGMIIYVTSIMVRDIKIITIRRYTTSARPTASLPFCHVRLRPPDHFMLDSECVYNSLVQVMYFANLVKINHKFSSTDKPTDIVHLGKHRIRGDFVQETSKQIFPQKSQNGFISLNSLSLYNCIT